MQPPLNHFTSPDFWSLYNHLPAHARQTADKYFGLLKSDPMHQEEMRKPPDGYKK